MLPRLLLFFFSLVVIAASSCPSDGLVWNSKCYVFNSTEVGFAKAEMACVKIGGHLVSVHDAFTNDVFGQNAEDFFPNESDFWIGASTLTSNSNWTWTDGSYFDFTDWASEQPSDTSGYRCAAESTHDGYWRMTDCFENKPFICNIASSQPASSPRPPVTTTTTRAPLSTRTTTRSTTTRRTSNATPSYSRCQNGWTYFEPTNSCYLFDITSMSWDYAESFCRNFSAHLLSIHSEQESTFVNQYVIAQWHANWIGLFSLDSGSTWQWADGSPVDYVVWEYGTPNAMQGKNCVALTTAQHSGPGMFSVASTCNYSTWYYPMCKKPAYF